MSGYNLRFSQKRKKLLDSTDQPKGRKQAKTKDKVQPTASDTDMAGAEIGLADIYNLIKGVEVRMANVEDLVNDHTNALGSITGDNEVRAAPDEVFLSDGEDLNELDMDTEVQSIIRPLKQHTITGTRPKVFDNPANKAAPKQTRQPRGGGARGGRGGRGRGGGGRGKGNGTQNTQNTRRASVGAQLPIQKSNTNQVTKPRRSSTSASGSSLTHAQRKEIMGMLTNKMMRQRAHDDLASFQVIIHGTIETGNKFEDEAKVALDLLTKIYPHCKMEDIDQIHRFPILDDDGTKPMCVTFDRRSVADILNEKWQANKSAFPWFDTSKSREVRRFNANEARAVEELNANAPDNDALVWELKPVGALNIRRRVPNPNYKPPAIPAVTVAGHKTQPQQQRSQIIHRNPKKLAEAMADAETQ